ncbi:MAG TPA: hypothetical protein VIM38_11805 [Alphaproteobacteria bacterium]
MPNKRATAGRIRIDLQRRTPYRFSLMAARQTRCLAEMYMQKFALSVTRWSQNGKARRRRKPMAAIRQALSRDLKIVAECNYP